MIRKVIIPKTEKVNISLRVPKNYIGKELELIAFAKDEGMQEKGEDRVRGISFTVLSIKDKKFRFNRDEANER